MSRNGRGSDGVVPAFGILLVILFGSAFAVFASMALSSRFGGGGDDPHGYALIFGTFFALGAGLVTALGIPLIFTPRLRATAFLGSLIGYLAVAAGLVTALLTA
ncbi:hypothetical protein [Microbacterium hydrocarbonoxydans]|uniref:hypothetical protein n=1 Tax=Microbacterium hydrocarbonoxydans TaxID=273678 RepID=UPI0013D9934A|nr:hypothetical protein [Microbacterium hydrocarbonoxydans]